MPEAVQNMVDINKDIFNYNADILNSIIESYFANMKKHVKNENETIKIRKIYNSLPIQLGNNSHKFQYSKIEDNSKAREYENPFEWLLASFMIINSFAISKPSIPLEGYKKEDIFKIYFSDVLLKIIYHYTIGLVVLLQKLILLQI